MNDKPRRKVEIELLPDGNYELTLVQWRHEPKTSWDDISSKLHPTLADAQREVYVWFKGVE
jgi:hypothetical protein